MGELLTHQQTLRYVADRPLGLDIRYDLGAGGASAHPLVGGWAPDLPLRADGGGTRLATLMHGARPVLLDLTVAAAGCGPPRPGGPTEVQATVARSDEPLDGILVCPDRYVAWAATPGDHNADRLRQALRKWSGVAG